MGDTAILIAVIGAAASVVAAWFTARPVRLRSKTDREVEFRDDLMALYEKARDCCEDYRRKLVAEEERRLRAEMRVEAYLRGLTWRNLDGDEAEGS